MGISGLLLLVWVYGVYSSMFIKTLYKMSNTIEISTLEQFKGMVATVKKGSGQFDQEIKWHRIGSGAEQGKITTYDVTKFKRRNVECDGPILPYEAKKKGQDMGPKRPCIKTISAPGTEELEFLKAIDLTVRAAYELSGTKLGQAFKDFLTFTYRPIKLMPGRNEKEPKDAYEVMVVGTTGWIKPLSECIPEGGTYDEKQTEAISLLEKGKRIIEKDCVDTSVKDCGTSSSVPGGASSSPTKLPSCKKFVFDNLVPRIHEKTGRLYFEMHLLHRSYPNDTRMYRGPKNPHNPAMSDIKNWGITIPILAKTKEGGYVQFRDSDWTKDPSCKPVTKDGEHNNFIGTINFSVGEIMEGSGHVKTWWKCSVAKQPEPSTMTNDNNADEEIVDAPAGEAISLAPVTATKSSPGARVTGTATVGDDDD